MSVFGSMTTAVSGLAAQARALGNLSDNIANSQTIGYKRVETSFATLVTQSNADVHSPGGVRAKPTYTNSLQGNISQTESTTNLALSGAGFFQVSRGTEDTSGVDFQSTPYFTRAGDFSLDRFGYLKNNAGMYLNGWALNDSGDINRGTISPIRIQQLIDTPTATQNINLSANLPLSPTKANLDTQTISIIDETGVERELQLNWRQQATGDWRLSVNAPGSTSAITGGSLPSTATAASIGTPFQAIGPTPAVQQISVVTSTGAIVANTDYSVTVNNQTFTYKATAADVLTPDNVMYQLWSQIQGANAAPGGAAYAGGIITLRGDSEGAVMNVSTNPAAVLDPAGPGSVPATPGVKEELYIPVAGPAGNVGDVYEVNFTAADPTFPTITYTTDGTEANAKTLAERIAAKINADSTSPVTATVSGAGLKLVSKSSATPTIVGTTTAVTPGTMPAHVNLKFDGGYLQSMNTSNIGTGTAQVPPSQSTGDPAYIEFVVNYGNGPQTIKLNLGKFGEKDSGLSQFKGSNLETFTQTPDGFTRGAFQNLEIKASGDVVAT